MIWLYTERFIIDDFTSIIVLYNIENDYIHSHHVNILYSKYTCM